MQNRETQTNQKRIENRALVVTIIVNVLLAAADVGIAVGGGSDAAIEAADAALLAGSLSPLSEAILIARRARLVAYTNIVFALSVKALVLILGALGYAPMWAAIFADVGVMALSVLNAATVLVYRKK